jgi:GMP synthase-like glutamine amidotransferase
LARFARVKEVIIMILVLNCINENITVDSFERAISRSIQKTGLEADFVRIAQTQEMPDLSRYTHVIISGSEASVVEDNPWDDRLKEIILRTIALEKPLLGICYGHQFLVRTLLGKQSVRRTATPEFGWLKISLSKNPLFAGISEGVFMESHYDEVCNLSEDFRVLAVTPRCTVQALQYRDLPVWGVQFHPEYHVEEANEIFDLVKERDPLFPTYFLNALQNETQLEQNERIFLNFLNL